VRDIYRETTESTFIEFICMLDAELQSIAFNLPHTNKLKILYSDLNKDKNRWNHPNIQYFSMALHSEVNIVV